MCWGKAVSHWAFDFRLISLRMGLGLEHFLRDKLSQLCWTYHLVWEYISWIILKVYSIVRFNYVHHMAPGQSLCCICPILGRGQSLSVVAWVDSLTNCPMSAERDSLVMGDYVHYWSWSSSASSLCSKPLFNPVFGCVIFLGNADIKMQLAEVLRLLLLTIGNRSALTIWFFPQHYLATS